MNLGDAWHEDCYFFQMQRITESDTNVVTIFIMHIKVILNGNDLK